ncbi:MAG: EamA family transporter RarD [Pseudomonadales bacterium]|nr:EamA family transporter RarD [Pseudomonadales bacterium]
MFEKKSIQGAYFALAAYLTWGIAPLYFKLLTHVGAIEILIQRVLWSLLLLLGILAYTGQLKKLKVSKKQLAILFCSALLLTSNWLIFIYAVLDNNIAGTSLGYFINPLVSVLLGMIFLGERLRAIQWLALIIATAGILVQLAYHGKIPLSALSLAFSFGFYGLIRKNLNLHAVAGLTLETLLVAPIALAGLLWLFSHQTLVFAQQDMSTDILLILGSFVTTVPLLCFAAAINRLSLTAVGIFQYIAPSISLLIAVIIYHEPFGIDKIITFGCIWVALGLFSVEAIHYQRRLQRRS